MTTETTPYPVVLWRLRDRASGSLLVCTLIGRDGHGLRVDLRLNGQLLPPWPAPRVNMRMSDLLDVFPNRMRRAGWQDLED